MRMRSKNGAAAGSTATTRSARTSPEPLSRKATPCARCEGDAVHRQGPTLVRSRLGVILAWSKNVQVYLTRAPPAVQESVIEKW